MRPDLLSKTMATRADPFLLMSSSVRHKNVYVNISNMPLYSDTQVCPFKDVHLISMSETDMTKDHIK